MIIDKELVLHRDHNCKTQSIPSQTEFPKITFEIRTIQ